MPGAVRVQNLEPVVASVSQSLHSNLDTDVEEANMGLLAFLLRSSILRPEITVILEMAGHRKTSKHMRSRPRRGGLTCSQRTETVSPGLSSSPEG